MRSQRFFDANVADMRPGDAFLRTKSAGAAPPVGDLAHAFHYCGLLSY